MIKNSEPYMDSWRLFYIRTNYEKVKRATKVLSLEQSSI